MEAFYTIQGEGYHQGKAAYFIRLAGCDVGCFWCDVKESWDASDHPVVPVHEIISGLINTPARIAVITGGEPLMYDLTCLTNSIHSEGVQTNIETSGVYPITGSWDWVCFSPKKFKEPHPSIFPVANELKVIVYNKSDLDWAESYANRVNQECKLYLQPEWSKHEELLPVIIEYVKNNPKWELSLQIHKYLNIP
ncbi:MAG: 7-carboxy-7-deazaguanine synthase QueE [Cytophagaceae bacterium]